MKSLRNGTPVVCKYACVVQHTQSTNLCRSGAQVRGGKDGVKELRDVFRPRTHRTQLHLTMGLEDLVEGNTVCIFQLTP